MSTPKLDLKPHPIVERLVKAPGAPPELSQLLGYIGPSSRPEYVRLYSSLTLEEFVDVPEKYIWQAEDVPDSVLDFGGTRLWVDASAEIIHEIQLSECTEAKFLEGSIASEHLTDAPVQRKIRAAEPAAPAAEKGVKKEPARDHEPAVLYGFKGKEARASLRVPCTLHNYDCILVVEGVRTQRVTLPSCVDGCTTAPYQGKTVIVDPKTWDYRREALDKDDVFVIDPSGNIGVIHVDPGWEQLREEAYRDPVRDLVRQPVVYG